MRFRTLLFVIFSFCASALMAQTVTIGNEFAIANYTDDPGIGGDVRTDVDLDSPATASGTITRAGFGWYVFAPCDAPSVKIKFFRRTGSVLTMVAERGPFGHDKSDSATIRLSPPVDVLEGDLIAITRMANDCGSGPIVMNMPGKYVQFRGDLTGTVDISAGSSGSGAVMVWGTSDVVEPAGVLPVVGSTEGSMGANWKTSVQLMNPQSATATGRLVFHPAGVRGTDSDPAYTYSLAAGATEIIPDVVAAMGRSGIGSIDVFPGEGQAGMPVVIAHLFNDAADGGTFGFSEEAFDPKGVASQCSSSTSTFAGTRILRARMSGFLIAPASATDARFNIGVRTLGDGARVITALYTAAGIIAATVTKHYPANYFEQLPAGDLLGVPLVGGESIRITISAGSAIVYGVANDNVSNDPRMQYVYSRSSGTTE